MYVSINRCTAVTCFIGGPIQHRVNQYSQYSYIMFVVMAKYVMNV